MQIRQLQIFVALAEEQSFTRAARRVHIVQSGVSAAIKELEIEFGARLFERTTKLVSLTSHGATLLTHARHSLAAIETAKRCIGSAHVARTHLRLAIRPVLQCLDLAALVTQFRERCPNLTVQISEMTDEEISSCLLAGSLDLGLSILVSATQWQRFKVTNIQDDCLVLLCSRRHELASLSSVKLRDLHSQAFIDSTRDTPLRQIVDAHYADLGLTRNAPFEVSDPTLAISLVERNLGITLMPARFALQSRRVNDIHVLHLDPADAFPSWQVVALSQNGLPQRMGEVAGQFLSFLLDACAKRSQRPVRLLRKAEGNPKPVNVA